MRISGRDHFSSVLPSLHWFPVKFRILFKIIPLMYKAPEGLTPSYIKEHVVPYNPGRTLCSKTADLLVVLEYLEIDWVA